MGIGPVYGGGVEENVGVLSRPATPPGGFAQCRVGSTVRRWGTKLLLESTSRFHHVVWTVRLTFASTV